MSSLQVSKPGNFERVSLPQQTAQNSSLDGRSVTKVNQHFPKPNLTLSKVLLASVIIVGAGIAYTAKSLYMDNPLPDIEKLNTTEVKLNNSIAEQNFNASISDTIANDSIAIMKTNNSILTTKFNESIIEAYFEKKDGWGAHLLSGVTGEYYFRPGGRLKTLFRATLALEIAVDASIAIGRDSIAIQFKKASNETKLTIWNAIKMVDITSTKWTILGLGLVDALRLSNFREKAAQTLLIANLARCCLG